MDNARGKVSTVWRWVTNGMKVSLIIVKTQVIKVRSQDEMY